MARMMDDSSRARILSQMLSQQGGSEDGPPSGYPEQTNSMEGVQNIGAQRLPPNGLQQDAPQEEMIPVPASLAHAGMQALMSQASGGRSMGADGQVAGNLMSDEDMAREMGMSNPANRVEPEDAEPVEDPERVEMMRRGRERRGRSA